MNELFLRFLLCAVPVLFFSAFKFCTRARAGCISGFGYFCTASASTPPISVATSTIAHSARKKIASRSKEKGTTAMSRFARVARGPDDW